MQTKIVTGKFKGKTLSTTQANKELRPTQALIRESIINTCLSLYDFDFSELEVLDLYSGIGTMGLEFLSSGVKSVTFVEKHSSCKRAIEENLQKFSAHKQGFIIQGMANTVIKRFKKSVDLVFLDPPFKQRFEITIKIIQDIILQNILSDKGYLIFQTS